MKYRLIDAEKPHHAVSRLARALGVSRSGYHAWKHRRPSALHKLRAPKRMHVEDHADPSEVSQNKAGTGTATRRMTAFLGEVGARHARQGMHRTQGIAPIWVEQGLRSLREDAVGELDTRID